MLGGWSRRTSPVGERGVRHPAVMNQNLISKNQHKMNQKVIKMIMVSKTINVDDQSMLLQ